MTNQSNEHIPVELIEKLRTANSVTILTGAGISSESGIPTFRDSQIGLWSKYDPNQLATPQAFRDNPHLVMDWYRWRRDLVSRARPNPGHFALVTLERKVRQFTLITQNVDGLHASAGSINRIELHGNLQLLLCSNPNCDLPAQGWPDEDQGLPGCPRCGSLLRPDVVWFGEMLPRAALEAAVQASQQCELFFSIGTSGIVEPAASLPYKALRAKAIVVEINPQPTPLTIYAQHYFTQPAGQILPALVEAAWPSA